MIANYHTHTWRCGHAIGTEEEYVRCALERGLSTLGFSDHSPYLFSDGYVSRIRMKPEELADYADCVHRMQQQYGNRLQILLGVEMEYYPACFSRTLSLLKEHGVEYLILGQHYLENEMGAIYSGRETDSEAVLAAYCAQTREGIQTGAFTYLAHPDLVYYVGPEAVYRQYMRGLCRDAKSAGLPLEINLLGVRGGRQYPNRVFWELVAEEGCAVVLGCDAHEPESLLETEDEAQALRMVQTLGLTLLPEVPLRRL